MTLTTEDVEDRLARIRLLPDTYVVMPRTNPEPCGNCGGCHPVYRYRLGAPCPVCYFMRTFCACGYVQYPGHWWWRFTGWWSSQFSWAKFCWKMGRWVSRKVYFS